MIRRLLCSLGAVAIVLAALAAPSDAQPGKGPYPCAKATSLLKEGKLGDAKDVAEGVGPACAARVAKRSAQATEIATKLAVRAEREQDADEKARLLGLAFAFDAANPKAREVKGKDPAQEPGPCDAANAALDRGEYALAEALFDAQSAVATAKDCVAAGKADLATARAQAMPTRVRGWFTNDAWPLLLLMLVCFAVGVLVAGTARVRGGWTRASFAAAITLMLATCTFLFTQGILPFADHRVLVVWVVTALVVAIGLIAAAVVGAGRIRPELYFALVAAIVVAAVIFGAGHLESTRSGATLLGVTLLGTAATGFFASTAARNGAPLRIEVRGDGAKDLPAQVIAELRNLGETPASGVYAMAGTDLADSGVTGALEQIGNPVAKAVFGVWNAILRGSASRVVLTLTAATDKEPCSATVANTQSGRSSDSAAIDGADFLVDPAKPTAEELADSTRDVATAIAAQVLMWRLDAKTEHRLYGATKPDSIALAVVGGRRARALNPEAATTLYRRAVDRDVHNRAARFSHASQQLHQYPDETEAQPWIEQLGKMADSEDTPKGQSPLLWRLRYNHAAALANVAVGEITTSGMSVVPFDLSTAVVNAHDKLEQLLTGELPLDKPQVVSSDDELWERLKGMAKAACRGLTIARDDAGGGAARKAVEALKKTPLTVSDSEQLNVVGGLAVAARSSHFIDVERIELADLATRRLRLAGSDPARREAMLADPFVLLLKGFAQFDALAKNWSPKTPYDGIATFGKLAPTVADFYAKPAALAEVLSTESGAANLSDALGVDRPTVRAWRGAADWLVRGRKAQEIDLVQAAGYPDRASLASASPAAASARIASTAKTTGRDAIGDEELAAMRLP